MEKMAADIYVMHDKFGVHDIVRKMNFQQKVDYLRFRVSCLKEEINEIEQDLVDPENVVDGLIDLVVFAIGTLDAFDVEVDDAWLSVMAANMSKEPGIKPERPNPMGFPDMIKPTGWKAPSHEGNHGILPKVP